MGPEPPRKGVRSQTRVSCLFVCVCLFVCEFLHVAIALALAKPLHMSCGSSTTTPRTD